MRVAYRVSHIAAGKHTMAFRFEGLEIFQLAVDYAQMVYDLTKGVPKEETFGLTANLRRAGTSVALNIAEGCGRGTDRDFMHFIEIARGSVFESFASFMLAERLGYIIQSDLHRLRERADKLARKLISFKNSLSGDKR